MASLSGEATAGGGEHEPEGPPRRDFLALLAGATAAIGVGAVVWPFIDSLEPARDTLAAGAPIDIDLTPIEPGQQLIVLWREKPMLIVNRPDSALKALQTKAAIDRISDPDSKERQQPTYAQNYHRSIKPEWLVAVGICTHLGCLPGYFPKPSPTTPEANWPGGYLCPCHGSKYDLSARVWKNVPAPLNLPVPPYTFINDKTVRIGENPQGSTWSLNDVVTL